MHWQISNAKWILARSRTSELKERPGRAAMDQETMEVFGLATGQTVSWPIWKSITNWKIRACEISQLTCVQEEEYHLDHPSGEDNHVFEEQTDILLRRIEMNTQKQNKQNPILTIILETGGTVLAKKEKGTVSALKYGNETQARAKVDAIRDQLCAAGQSASVVRSGNRFLVLVYMARPIDQRSDELAIAGTQAATDGLKKLASRFAALGSVVKSAVEDVDQFNGRVRRTGGDRSEKTFATPSGTGTRFNPRNRHNHPWSSDRKYEYRDQDQN